MRKHKVDAITSFESLKDDLLEDHWKHRYSWIGISIGTTAKMYDVSMDDVRQVMREIQNEHPKPVVRYTKVCSSCKRTIGFVRTKLGKYSPVNLDDLQPHWIRCPGAKQHRKRKRK